MLNYAKDFPILQQRINNKKLIYLDNAATTQKPACMIDALTNYYISTNANIHRGVHTLSERATAAYEKTRQKIQQFINAKNAHEIIFTKGTTEAINLVAHSFGLSQLKPDDEIIISALEHHSNIVPWQLIARQTGAKIKVIPMNQAGELIQSEYAACFSARTKIVALNHVSNALGTINPIQEMIDLAHEKGVPVLIDGAQAVPHLPVDVQTLDCDFYVFSAHKLYGPTGVGVLYGKSDWLNRLPPYQGGGDMIKQVSYQTTTYNDLPYKFEAGTPNIADVIAFAASIDYLMAITYPVIQAHEMMLLDYAEKKLQEIPGLRLIGTARAKGAVVSFVMQDLHPHDIGTILDSEGVAIRSGHHCAMPIMDFFAIPATVRASFALYNTREDIDTLCEGLLKVKKLFNA